MSIVDDMQYAAASAPHHAFPRPAPRLDSGFPSAPSANPQMQPWQRYDPAASREILPPETGDNNIITPDMLPVNGVK